MSALYLGIDQSKRSTGMVLVDKDGNLADYRLMSELKLDNEQLIVAQLGAIGDFLEDNLIADEAVLTGALIEGLSFGSVGAGKDFLAGLQWSMRVFMLENYRFLGTVPVTMWRSKVLTKEEQKRAKAEGKDGLKNACVDKLPEEVHSSFKAYVSKIGAKKASLYDLTDAYWIAQHCRLLSTCK